MSSSGFHIQRSALHEIGRDLAGVNNVQQLQFVLEEKINKFLPRAASLTLKIDQTGHQANLFPGDPKHMETPIPISDPFLSTALSQDTPSVFHLDQQTMKKIHPLFARLHRINGVTELVIAPFGGSKHATGLLVVFLPAGGGLGHAGIDLVGDISSLLSIVMSNIIANERIQQQMREIDSFRQRLEGENQYLQEEIQTTHNYREIVGTSQPMNQVFHLLSQVAPTQSSVLLLGETGTGKELIARAVHNASLRKDKLMVKVNCATLPANLIESELFGHEKGSFTGATDRRTGKFELANNSTLFLDEIGELPLDLQVKLLRALQEKEIERVGGSTVIRVDVRIIAATNRDLEMEVKAGRFRSDLFFRLNVFPITIPTLRQRKEDIPRLTLHFLEKYSKRSNQRVTGVSTAAMTELMGYEWPGNVRELEHLVERTILLTRGPTIGHFALPVAIPEGRANKRDLRFKTIDEIEREHIMAVLASCRGRIGGPGGAAELLKLPVTTLHSKIKRLGIKKKYSDD